MISLDTNCLFESMRIGKTAYFFTNIKNMTYMEKVYEEIERDKEKFIKECEEMLPTLNQEYEFNIQIAQIKAEFDEFVKNKCPISSERIKEIKEKVIKDIIQLKGIKLNEGDIEIICYSRLEKSTVVTHDENLFSLLINYAKTIFLIEFIMENKEKLKDISKGVIKYLWYGCLRRYDLALKDLRTKFGIIGGNNLYLRRLRILNYLEEVIPLQNKTIIPTQF